MPIIANMMTMDPIAYLDIVLRFSGITCLFLILIFTCRDLRSSARTKLLAAACISVIALLLGYTPEFLNLPESVRPFLRFLDVPHLVLIWLFAMSLFQEKFSIWPVYAAIGLIYCMPIFITRLAEFGFISGYPAWIIPLVSIASLILVGHLVTIALVGRSDDLRVERRDLRIWFVAVMVGVTILAAVSEAIPSIQAGLPRQTVKALTIWPGIVFASYWLLSVEPGKITFAGTVKTGQLSTLAEAKNAELLRKLENHMQSERPYLEAGLSIDMLAGQLALPTHRLRYLINQSLGYENFSSYVNSHRIESVKQALSNPNQAHLPILTIALDNGFTSLPSFNRAFRKFENVTPSTYRKENLRPVR